MGTIVRSPRILADLRTSPIEATGAAPTARIGPNAVTQTLDAVRERLGARARAALAAEAGIPASFPDGLVPEAWFVHLIETARATLAEPDVEWILRRSGALTGAYVTENRIPRPFRVLLRILPERLGLPLLLSAFRRHAWTFAGGARFRVEGPYPGTLVLEGAPTCRIPGPANGSGCWYESAFQTLLALAAPGIRVREAACENRGDAACRFELEPRAPMK